MDCDKIDLIGYIDGLDISKEEKAHIAECDRCQQEIRELKGKISLLRMMVEEKAEDCPEAEMLVNLVAGELEPLDSLLVEAHLARCGTCKALHQAVLEAEAGYEFSPPTEPTDIPTKFKGRIMAKKTEARKVGAATADLADVDEDLPMAAGPSDLADVDEEEDEKDEGGGE